MRNAVVGMRNAECEVRNAERKLTLRLPQWGKLSSGRETDEVSCCKGIFLCDTSPTANAVPPLPLERAKECGTNSKASPVGEAVERTRD